MANITIKKRVPLEFLNPDYKDAYLLFRSMSVPEYIEFRKKAKKVDDDGALDLIVNILQSAFLGGKFPDDEGNLVDVTKEDLLKFGPSGLPSIYQRYTGEQVDPKE